MLNMNSDSNINSIPFILFMEEMEEQEKLKRQQLANQNASQNRHDPFFTSSCGNNGQEDK